MTIKDGILYLITNTQLHAMWIGKNNRWSSQILFEDEEGQLSFSFQESTSISYRRFKQFGFIGVIEFLVWSGFALILLTLDLEEKKIKLVGRFSRSDRVLDVQYIKVDSILSIDPYSSSRNEWHYSSI